MGVCVGGGWEAASLTYGPQACTVWPGDRMMDGLDPRARAGARPLSLIGPSAASQPGCDGDAV